MTHTHTQHTQHWPSVEEKIGEWEGGGGETLDYVARGLVVRELEHGLAVAAVQLVAHWIRGDRHQHLVQIGPALGARMHAPRVME